MPLAAEIRDFLDFFCDGPAKVDYATLVDGPWGCGKTYFIKQYLRDREDKAKKVDPLVGAPYLYVSLYGVASIEQLRDNFFAQAHPLLNAPAAKIVGNAALSVVGRYTGLKGLVPGVRLSSLFPRLDARVLVFDDLERASVPVITALGWINEFVETGDFRVVIIGSQADVPKDQQADFAVRKEKVIGRTILFEADPAAAFSTFVGEIRNPQIKQVFSDNSDAILDAVRSSSTVNLRSLRAAIGNYARLVGAVDPRVVRSADASRQLLLYILAVEMEFKRGLGPDGLHELMLPHGGRLYGERSESDKYREIQSKYPDVDWSYPIVPPDDVADLLLSGVLNVGRINEAISTHQLFASPDNLPSWRRIMVWTRRGQAAYRGDRADLLDDLAHHRITHPGAILHVVGTLLWLNDLGDALFPDLEGAMTKYVDELDAAGTLEGAIAVFEGSPPDSWAGYVYSFNDHPLFSKIRDHLHPAVSRAFDKKKALEAPDLLAKLQDTSNDGRFKILFENTREDAQYAGVPILHHIDPAAFVDVIIQEGVGIKTPLTALGRRYYWANECELLRERPWLEQVEADLRERIGRLDPPFARAFEKFIEPCLNELHFAVQQMAERCEPPVKDPDRAPPVVG